MVAPRPPPGKPPRGTGRRRVQSPPRNSSPQRSRLPLKPAPWAAAPELQEVVAKGVEPEPAQVSLLPLLMALRDSHQAHGRREPRELRRERGFADDVYPHPGIPDLFAPMNNAVAELHRRGKISPPKGAGSMARSDLPQVYGILRRQPASPPNSDPRVNVRSPPHRGKRTHIVHPGPASVYDDSLGYTIGSLSVTS
eukprot:TRINITY_DN55955_c0_g1_i1.p1 TRINITY_DN55955_c0_g1~~TRINITY_DN55955_c0_g1_i1.p1  ORF type:complete len:230 (+),score=52.16 TRINITY_DN55955_c0_g1_i1:103-690(+)